MTEIFKNRFSDETKTIYNVREFQCLCEPDTGAEHHYVLYLDDGFYVVNPSEWKLVSDEDDYLDFPLYENVCRPVRKFIIENGYLLSFPYSCEYYPYSDLDINPKECLYNVEAENKKECLSCKFEKSEIICIVYERGRDPHSSGFCAVELKCGLYLRFDLENWTIYQSSDDGYLYVNGDCVREPLTQEERGIGMIDVMNGDGYYDENGDFHSYHNYDD